MIVEMRTYTIQPGSTPEYFKVYETMVFLVNLRQLYYRGFMKL